MICSLGISNFLEEISSLSQMVWYPVSIGRESREFPYWMRMPSSEKLVQHHTTSEQHARTGFNCEIPSPLFFAWVSYLALPQHNALTQSHLEKLPLKRLYACNILLSVSCKFLLFCKLEGIRNKIICFPYFL